MMANTVPEVFLPGKSHGHRSLADCSPRGHKESDTTEATGNPHTVPDEVPRVSRGWALTPLQSASSGQRGASEGPEIGPSQSPGRLVKSDE